MHEKKIIPQGLEIWLLRAFAVLDENQSLAPNTHGR